MNMFYDFKNDSLVNIGKIKEVNVAKKDSIRVIFDDDSVKIYNAHGDARNAVKRFGKTITQIVPCDAPLYNVFMNDDETYFYERVHFLALCADGVIRSIDGSDGFFELSDEANNYVGYFNEDRLGDYPESKN